MKTLSFLRTYFLYILPDLVSRFSFHVCTSVLPQPDCIIQVEFSNLWQVAFAQCNTSHGMHVATYGSTAGSICFVLSDEAPLLHYSQGSVTSSCRGCYLLFAKLTLHCSTSGGHELDFRTAYFSIGIKAPDSWNTDRLALNFKILRWYPNTFTRKVRFSCQLRPSLRKG